jgi:hypothetical protein
MAEQTLKIYEAALHAKRRDVVPRPARGIILEAEKQSSAGNSSERATVLLLAGCADR